MVFQREQSSGRQPSLKPKTDPAEKQKVHSAQSAMAVDTKAGLGPMSYSGYVMKSQEWSDRIKACAKLMKPLFERG